MIAAALLMMASFAAPAVGSAARHSAAWVDAGAAASTQAQAADAGQISETSFDFTVTSATGQPLPASTLLAGDRRVIVYVAPGLEPAAKLVEALRKWSRDDARWRTGVIVVAAAPLDTARAWLRERWGDDELPEWVADADARGWRALGFEGSIGVAGVENGTVDWKLDGVIADPSVVKPSMRAWLGVGAP